MTRKIINNFLLYSSGFFISLYLHKGSISLHGGYDMYYTAFIFSWAFSSIISRKFKKIESNQILNILYTYTVSFFLMLGILAFIIFKFNLTGVSRFVILSSLIISFSIEISYFLYKNKRQINLKNNNLIYSIKAFTFEIALFGIVNLYLINELSGDILFNTENLLLFMSFYLSWFAGSFLGHHFHPAYRRKDYWTFIWQYIKSYIIILALAAFSAFINRIDPNKIVLISYGIITYSILSLLGISFYYYIKKYRFFVLNVSGFPLKGNFGDIMLNEKVLEIDNHYKPSFNGTESKVLNHSLKNLFLSRYPEVFDFLDKRINLNFFDNSYSLILKSNNILNIDFLPDNSLQLFLNLEKLNKIPNVNQYLAEVNEKLTQDGVFAGNFETDYLRHQSYLKKYPYYFAQLFYSLDLILNKVILRISFLRKLYSSLNDEIHKSISITEGLGRLYFSGFEVLHLKIIDDTMFFIAKKTKEPVYDVVPSTGLIFKMDRIGKKGKIFKIYKFRTMHPYSEYIQDLVYNLNGSGNGDKITDDFRVASWGKFLRKYWLDELPMLINLLKGDIKLVGVRPLSQAKFNLYPPDLQKLRTSTKPGLVPPFYADLPKSFDELLESEKKYLIEYNTNPLKTDIKYFIKCIYNILFKGSRSA